MQSKRRQRNEPDPRRATRFANDASAEADRALALRVTELALDTSDDRLFPPIHDRKKRAYLIALAETGNKVRAARVAGVHPSIIYKPSWREDRAFQDALAQAHEAAADVLEAEAHRRAVEGTLKPTGWYQGQPGAYVREYSDLLLIVQLKAARPEKYKDRMELGGAWNINVKLLPNWALERLRAGEHPATVLQAMVPQDLLRQGDSPTEGEAEDITGQQREAGSDGSDG